MILEAEIKQELFNCAKGDHFTIQRLDDWWKRHVIKCTGHETFSEETVGAKYWDKIRVQAKQNMTDRLGHMLDKQNYIQYNQNVENIHFPNGYVTDEIIALVLK